MRSPYQFCHESLLRAKTARQIPWAIPHPHNDDPPAQPRYEIFNTYEPDLTEGTVFDGEFKAGARLPRRQTNNSTAYALLHQ